MAEKRKTVGLVLGSGGGRGMAHFGVIKTLQKHNIPIDYVSGSSIGALIGAYFALNQEVDSLIEIFKAAVKKRSSFFDFAGRRGSVLGGTKIKKVLEQIFQDQTFDNLKLPFLAVSTDLGSGEAITLNSGKILEAVLPSISIPGVLPIYDQKPPYHLVDGGLSSALPIKQMLENFQPDVLIIVDLYTPKSKTSIDYTVSSVSKRVYELTIAKLSQINMTEIDRPAAILLPDTNEDWRNLFFAHIDDNVEKGSKECEAKILSIKQLLE